MRHISICDLSVSRSGEFAGSPLPFRIKIEVAKLLSKIGVSAVEAAPILGGKTDFLLIKSLASAVGKSTLVVPVDIMDPGSPSLTWEALKEAESPRIQVRVPVSTVQMEYFCHKKAAAVIDLIKSNVAASKAFCKEIEFVAEDFTRSDSDFLAEAVKAAVESGATLVTVADAAGNLLPDEFQAIVSEVKALLPEGVRLGVFCSNELHLADACAVASVRAGADEIKTMAFGNSTVSLKRFPQILEVKSAVCDSCCEVDYTKLRHVVEQINALCDVTRSKARTAVVSDESRASINLTVNDDIAAVKAVVSKLGYELGEDDVTKVYEAFRRLSGENTVGAKEIDAIVASVAFQVPPTFILDNFVINTGNIIAPTCQINIRKGDELLSSVCVGDGPVDAAFMAIDKIVGRHYELDDFQVRSVTEGREALGETVVRLRHDGRVYSGRGVSKDIVGSSLMAYINAINKIAYEEGEA
ncbi:MAG: hypothetical protein MJY56_05420 [Bacteroidales bacterium]|nr:hypothetical protein [Bacteroidales bacterium]